MKKLLYVLTFVLPVAMLANVNAADAKHRGYLEPRDNNATAEEAADYAAKDCVKKDCNCKNADCQMTNCNCKNKAMKKDMNKHMSKKEMKHGSHWLEKENREIVEDYNEAIYKIDKSQLDSINKKVLKEQAEQNRDLALKQAKEKADLAMEHKNARKSFKDEIMKDKTNRKAVKAVMDID